VRFSRLVLVTLRIAVLCALALLPVVAAASCAGFAVKGDAESAVAIFHAQLDDGRYADIYEASDDVFKDTTPRSGFIEVLQAVRRKLGAVRASNQTQFFSQERSGMNGGSCVELTYDTDFTDGRATETFHWRVANGRARLVAYNINSALLITR